jgi:hypothetical protein
MNASVARVAATFLCTILLCAIAASAAPAPAAWNPGAWHEESTIELRTTAPGEEPHWFKVWFVVLDGQLYVRLGSRAAGRFESNQTRPVIAVRIAGQEFPAIEGVAAPEAAARVGAAMGDKYWSDVFVRWVDHPLTLRLAPQ